MTHRYREPDARGRSWNLPPPLPGTPKENLHIFRTVDLMMTRGLTDTKKIKDTFKTFMVLAYMSECDVPIHDVVLVSQDYGDGRIGHFFAEKLPGDVRFAQKYDVMKRALEEAQNETSQLRNRIAALESQIAELGGEP